MKFEIEEFSRNINDAEFLEDLKRVNELLREKNEKLTFRKYKIHGKYSPQTLAERFGSWNQALEKAGIAATDFKNISLQMLFENMEYVWRNKGKQPTTRDMKGELSKYSDSAYLSRFGSWRKALEAFVGYIDGNSTYEGMKLAESDPEIKNPRSVNLRLRFKVLSRDNFTCQSCGASPAKNPIVELHVDHIIPWSKGGKTEESNLKTKCSNCNLGKGNEFNV